MDRLAVYELDGAACTSLEAFAKRFNAVVLNGHEWRGNLDALNDILRGGFGTPEGGFVLRILAAERLREHLGKSLFDTLLEIIRDHDKGGDQEEDGVILELA